MIENKLKQIKADAISAFEKADYPKAFFMLWQLGLDDFVSYAEKEVKKTDKIKFNWFTHPGSAEFFWHNFLLDSNYFHTILNSEFADQLLHYYFSRCKFISKDLESRFAKEFPLIFIKAIRVNQAFLQPERIDFLCSIQHVKELQAHQKLWRKIYEFDISLWSEIQKEVNKLSAFSLNDILFTCIIWIEHNRFQDNSTKTVNHLADVYSFFVELMLSKYQSTYKTTNSSEDFFALFLKVLIDYRKNERNIYENEVSKVLNRISYWIRFKDDFITKYCFNLSYQPKLENDLVVLQSTPEEYYLWMVDGLRYDINQLNYFLKGRNFVEALNVENPGKIPGKTVEEKELNTNLAAFKCALRLFLKDLGISSLKFHNTGVDFEKFIDPIITYSFNRQNRYEKSISKHIAASKNLSEVFMRLFAESQIKDIRNEPFFYMSGKEYFELNKNGLKDLMPNSTEDVINSFSYRVNKKLGFNRFDNHYNVWQKPFIKLGEFLFCPMIFFASNSWFYSFAQSALLQYPEKHETEKMEVYFGEVIRQKGWEVKVINNNEANTLEGDVDIFVEDPDSLLFIQLKRTYFRLNLKDAYYEHINTDIKAAKQLNEAEKFLSDNNSLYRITHKPVKWIVSSSFENIGAVINGCRKINYFEFINALHNPDVKSVSDLIYDLETDKNIKLFISAALNINSAITAQKVLSEEFKPLDCFENKQYRHIFFSDNEKKQKEYNALFNDALKYYFEDNKNDALILFQKCITVKPDDPDVYGAVATTLADMKIYNLSFFAFKRALDLCPNDPHISLNYALTLLESGKHYEGLTLSLALYELFPLLGDLRILFEGNFKKCIHNNLLSAEQVKELQTRWNNLI